MDSGFFAQCCPVIYGYVLQGDTDKDSTAKSGSFKVILFDRSVKLNLRKRIKLI